MGKDRAVMSTVWKALLGLALVVPLGAYVAGSLAASASDDPAPRHSITIRESDSTRSASPTPTTTPAPTRSTEPEVIVPGYDDLDDDHGGEDGGEDGGEEHSGHGGGDD